MEQTAQWQGNNVTVRARLVPVSLWTTASVEVLLDGQCILKTGGQITLRGAHSKTFIHAGASHSITLSWEVNGFGFSFPYAIEIDRLPVTASRARIENWPLAFVAPAVIFLGALAVFHFRHYSTK